MGNNVYNRTSHKLKSKCVKNPPEMWIRSANAFEAVIDPVLFAAVQRKMEELTYRKSNERMLDTLRSLLVSKGRLTSKLIDDAESLPCAGSYHQRFGSLLKAYELIGYQPPNTVAHAAARQEARTKRRRILSDIFADLRRSGLMIRFDWNRRAYVVNNQLTLAVYLLRCLKGKRGALQWTIRQRRKSNTNLVIGVRTDTANDSVRDYLLLRSAGLSNRLRNSDVNIEHLCATSIESIGDLTRALCDATLAT